MKKSEVIEMIRGIITEDLEDFIKPVIQKTVLEELGLVLLPVVKKTIKEQYGKTVLAREKSVPVSEFRTNLVKHLGLSRTAPSLTEIVRGGTGQRSAPDGSGVMSSILAETLNDIRPGDLEDLGPGEDFAAMGGGFTPQNYIPEQNMMPINNFMATNNPLDKLDETFTKDYSQFLADMDNAAAMTRGGQIAKFNAQQDNIRSKITEKPSGTVAPDGGVVPQ